MPYERTCLDIFTGLAASEPLPCVMVGNPSQVESYMWSPVLTEAQRRLWMEPSGEIAGLISGLWRGRRGRSARNGDSALASELYGTQTRCLPDVEKGKMIDGCADRAWARETVKMWEIEDEREWFGAVSHLNYRANAIVRSWQRSVLDVGMRAWVRTGELPVDAVAVRALRRMLTTSRDPRS